MRQKPDLVAALRGRGAVPSNELRAALGVSRPTLSRLIRDDDTVLRLGAGRRTHYALPGRVEGLSDRLPVFRIEHDGAANRVAELVPLDGGSWLENTASGSSRPLEGLPPFVHDMAPSGYLGRRFARRHADLELPDRLQDWHDHHRLIAVARRGEDATGSLIVGEESMDRYLGSEPGTHMRDTYPELAEAAGRGLAGSSAAGEQPKFTAFDGERHLLVKFTAGDGAGSDLRWRDLLVCESLAAATLDEAGIRAARATVVDQGSRRFLEIERFDRTPSGRRGVLTLGSIDDEYFGRRDDWCSAAHRLEEAGLLAPDDRRRLVLLDAFGVLISNGDRHFGNVSFFCDELEPEAGLELAPTHDVLPMDAAPSAGVLPEISAHPPRPRARHLEVWDEAGALAREFWRRVRADERISSTFRRMVDV